MTGLGNYGANMGPNAGLSAHVNANAAPVAGYGACCAPATAGYSGAGAILVLFILLVIITRTIYV